MPMLDIPSAGELNTIEDVRNYIYRFERSLRYLLNGKLSSDNINEIGGWDVGADSIISTSGNVGLYGGETSSMFDVRIWAGTSAALNDSAPFRVHEDGSVFASNIHINGGIIDWGNTTKPSYTADDVGALATSSPMLTYISPTGIYTGQLNANQINVGTLTGFTIRTASSGRRIEHNANEGFYSVDAGGIRRIQIQFTNDQWSNQDMVFRDGSGVAMGNLSTNGQGAFWIEGSQSLIMSFANRIELMAGTIDFNNATIAGFNPPPSSAVFS